MYFPPMVNTPLRSRRYLATTCLPRVLEQYHARRSSSWSTMSGCRSWTGRVAVETAEVAEIVAEQPREAEGTAEAERTRGNEVPEVPAAEEMAEMAAMDRLLVQLPLPVERRARPRPLPVEQPRRRQAEMLQALM